MDKKVETNVDTTWYSKARKKHVLSFQGGHVSLKFLTKETCYFNDVERQEDGSVLDEKLIMIIAIRR